jgi:hypothetical protein
MGASSSVGGIIDDDAEHGDLFSGEAEMRYAMALVGALLPRHIGTTIPANWTMPHTVTPHAHLTSLPAVFLIRP